MITKYHFSSPKILFSKGQLISKCKKQQTKVPDQLLVCGIGDLWSTWMIPNWFYMSLGDSPDHPGSILYHSESSEVPYFKVSTLLLSYVVPVKNKVEISQNLVAFSEYMNFTIQYFFLLFLTANRLYGRNYYKYFIGFLVDLKTPKGHNSKLIDLWSHPNYFLHFDCWYRSLFFLLQSHWPSCELHWKIPWNEIFHGKSKR